MLVLRDRGIDLPASQVHRIPRLLNGRAGAASNAPYREQRWPESLALATRRSTATGTQHFV